MDEWYGLRPNDRLVHTGAFDRTYPLADLYAGHRPDGPLAEHAAASVPAPISGPIPAPRFWAAPGVYLQMLRSATPTRPDLRHGPSADERLAAITRAAWENASGNKILRRKLRSDWETAHGQA